MKIITQLLFHALDSCQNPRHYRRPLHPVLAAVLHALPHPAVLRGLHQSDSVLGGVLDRLL